jgi:hypothetical protein
MNAFGYLLATATNIATVKRRPGGFMLDRPAAIKRLGQGLCRKLQQGRVRPGKQISMGQSPARQAALEQLHGSLSVGELAK